MAENLPGVFSPQPKSLVKVVYYKTKEFAPSWEQILSF